MKGTSTFDMARGLYWYCANNHGGQGSDLYRVMCATGYTPNTTEREPIDSDDDPAYAVYSDLENGLTNPEEALAAIKAAR